MLFTKVFKVLPAKEWNRVPSGAQLLNDIPKFSNRAVKFYSATEIQKYLEDDGSFVLLCFATEKIHSYSCSFDGISTFPDSQISIDCVERVIDLPIEDKGLSKLPSIYDSVFLGQELDDFVEKLPSVPDAKTVEKIIPGMIEKANHPKICVHDVVACFDEAFTRLSYGEELSRESLMPVDDWLVVNWIPSDENDYELISPLVFLDLEKLQDKFFNTNGIENKSILTIVEEVRSEMA
jgi:hypothetical protein